MRGRLKQIIPPSCEPVSLNEAKEHLVVEHDDDNIKIAGFIKTAREWCEEYTHRQFISATFEYYLTNFPSEIILPKNPVLKVTAIKYLNNSNNWTALTENIDYTIDITNDICSIIPAYGTCWRTPKYYRNNVKITYQSGYLIPYSLDVETNILTLSNYTAADGETFIATHNGGETGALPSGLNERTIYYICDSTGSTCKLSSSSGGTAIDIKSSGKGQQFLGEIPQVIKTAILLLVGHWYENREQVLKGTISKEIEMSAMDLLSRYISPLE